MAEMRLLAKTFGRTSRVMWCVARRRSMCAGRMRQYGRWQRPHERTQFPFLDVDVSTELADVHAVRARGSQKLDSMGGLEEAEARG